MTKIMNSENKVLHKKAGAIVLLIAMTVITIVNILTPTAVAQNENTTTTATPTTTVTATITATPTTTATVNTTATPTITATVNTTATPTITATVNTTATPTITATVNTTATPTITATVNTTDTASTSGSPSVDTIATAEGSGGEIITEASKDTYGNMLKYEKKSLDIVANELVNYSFTTLEPGIYEVSINGKNNEFDIPIKVEDLIGVSGYAGTYAPGTIYKNENVWIGTKRINYITVRFKVNNSWMEYNNLDNVSYPRLLKWNGTAWLVIKTNIIGRDGKYTYLEAPRAGSTPLSIFAISAPRDVAKGDPWPTNTTNIGNGSKEQIVFPNESKTYEVEPKRAQGFDMMTTLAGIILVTILVIRKR
jgi:PGF-pre-PGF domain-containing protein